MDHQARRPSPGIEIYRFWQIGPVQKHSRHSGGKVVEGFVSCRGTEGIIGQIMNQLCGTITDLLMIIKVLLNNR